ncbi:PHD-finger family protein [Carpediemonas membranifera]|uniref:PHD-finger family protein n=1 Tax=Carpediemonas membranifera TaxID=201153 RepID=A0A8J6E345_9EUKA|nr:PHD-finger family protein [Carpediemonas membranifera]|eukprot:KAG9392677.1 PHD-finger family protein [Carpediemonas membranifera]
MSSVQFNYNILKTYHLPEDIVRRLQLIGSLHEQVAELMTKIDTKVAKQRTINRVKGTGRHANAAKLATEISEHYEELVAIQYEQVEISAHLQEMCDFYIDRLATTLGSSMSEMQSPAEDDENVPYCYCGGPDDGQTMYECESTKCPFNRWFHAECLKKRGVPVPGENDDHWLCPTCAGIKQRELAEPRP